MIPDDQRFQVVFSTLSETRPSFSGPSPGDLVVCRSIILDKDQRRRIRVTTAPVEYSTDYECAAYAWRSTADAEPIRLLRRHISQLERAPQIVAITLDQDGEILSMSADPQYYLPEPDHVYPFLDELPPVETVLRSELIELDRIAGICDLVSYRSGPAQGRTGIFKSSLTDGQWTGLQATLRLPPHPHLLPIDYAVLEEMECKLVVGYTMRVIPNGDLKSDYHRARPFKLKWLRQLMQTVDDLNLRFGVVHQDIRARNCLIDPETDNLLLVDFGFSAWVGQKHAGIHGRNWEPGERRSDVEGVMLFLCEIITRADDSDIFDILAGVVEADSDLEWRDKLVKHPDVELDHNIDMFYHELVSWVKKRRSGGTSPQTRAIIPEAIRWPPYPDRRCDWSGSEEDDSDDKPDLREKGPRVPWQRPASTMVDRSRILLATGKYADESESENGNKKAASEVAGPSTT
ncbi:hypothetical protein QBC46DRAFT_391765 [Diplogelasinospora grovesii]|uniref:non-specific serine/threonine protein kinase n=1 Tax=Diplogelasinospora grovesii TaxID=303347 RepID=A0AAN6N271_9PEZI|nr:hypothetical protein QBC46DRAFT_391765 [Diplogelasinospora grovesii]